MKRLITAILLVSMTITGFAKTRKDSVPKDGLMTLVREYSGRDGFEVIKIGSFGTGARRYC